MDELTPRQILDRLVGFPTVSTGSNMDLVDWLDGYLQGQRIETHRHWNEDGQKAALMAHAGPRVPGAVVLSGHSDVVPVVGQSWDSDPWVVTERDGRLYGRGTCDMKGYVALAVWALVRAARGGVKRPLQLALSYDEELGCTGAPPMIAAMQHMLPKGEVALIGEPSGMAVITGTRAARGFTCMSKAMRCIPACCRMAYRPSWRRARLISWVNDRNTALQATAGVSAFYPPFTTLHVGMISGGTAHNITAADCRFAVEMRVLPGEDMEHHAADFVAAAQVLDASLKARRPEAGVSLTRFFGVPGLRPELGGAAEALAVALTGANGTGVVSYGTEAGNFNRRAIPP